MKVLGNWKKIVFTAWALVGGASLCAGSVPYKVDEGWTIHGPFTQGNLGVFLIEGKEVVAGDVDFVTLSEGMEKGWVVVHETGNVNQLSVENVSADRTVVILAGAIVKGGKQDRVLGMDLVLKPKSGKVPVSSFCVEQSRWSARGKENVRQFSSNSASVAGKGLRKAVKGGRGQAIVWQEVAQEQKRLSENVEGDVQQNASPTSYQLAVENKELQKDIAAMKKHFDGVLKDFPGAVGYAVTVNGEFSTADVYASRGLFRKMWDQHLEGAITEAISLKKKATSEQPVDLSWRDKLFKEKAYEQKVKQDTGGDNDYVAGQSDGFFRYQSSLKDDSGVRVRMSFEKREEGEELNALNKADPAETRGQEADLNSLRRVLRR